jgi:hypothetical protein
MSGKGYYRAQFCLKSFWIGVNLHAIFEPGKSTDEFCGELKEAGAAKNVEPANILAVIAHPLGPDPTHIQRSGESFASINEKIYWGAVLQIPFELTKWRITKLTNVMPLKYCQDGARSRPANNQSAMHPFEPHIVTKLGHAPDFSWCWNKGKKVGERKLLKEQSYRVTGLQGYRVAELQSCRVTGLQSCRDMELGLARKGCENDSSFGAAKPFPAAGWCARLFQVDRRGPALYGKFMGYDLKPGNNSQFVHQYQLSRNHFFPIE